MEAKGHFDLTLFRESKYRDRDFEEAIKRGELDHLLLEVGAQRRAGGDNMLTHNLVPTLFYQLFTGAGQPPESCWYYSYGSGPGLGFVYLSTIDDEVTYQEKYQIGTGYGHSIQACWYAANTSSGSKRFYNDQIAAFECWSHADGVKQQIFFRNRWLYLPTEGYSNDIRSLIIVWNMNAPGTAVDGSFSTWTIGRVRLKDEAGEKVRINKTAYQAMLMEYTFSLVSV